MLSSNFKKSVGAAGENAAAVYLVKKGYKILERNYLGRRFEIDIIAADQNGEIHFVEVKTRKNEKFGKGIEFVTPAKLNAIKRGALSYMSMLGKDLNMHFDEGSAFEIWVANILFIAASVGAMFYGSKTEQNIFFNYGLTFLIIETYTICGRLASHLPEGLATLMFGGLLIITAKYLKKVYLKKKIKKVEEEK